jgi:Glycosyl hydrolase catalytic core
VQGAAQGSRLVSIRIAIVLGVLGLSLCGAPAAGARTEFFGIVQGPTLDNRDLRGMANAQIRTNRFVLKWGWVQPNKGWFKWDSPDRFIGELASHGIRAFPALWGNPNWVYGSPARPPLDGPEAVQAWRDFLRGLVARYGPGGSYWATEYRRRYGASAKPLPIRAWQIWNEPNLHKYFAPYPSAESYARLLRISHDAIRSKDPRARIVLAGMPGHGDVEASEFLARLYSKAGIKNEFDAVAIHPYARGLDRQRLAIERVRAVMRNHGDGASPLWLTELGWGSAPADGFGINRGLDGQARSLAGSLRLILNHRKAWNVARVFWFHWRDPQRSQAGTCSFCGSAGLLRYNRAPKPAHPKFLGFTAETVRPEASIVGPGNGGITNDSTPRFSFASNEVGSTFVCRFDAEGYARCSSPVTPDSPLEDGPHSFSVKAIDAPGNVSQVVSRPFVVDTQAPTVEVSSGPEAGSTSSDRNPSFSFASSESDVSLACQLDGAGFQDCSSPLTASGLADGSHTFQVKAQDRAGNQGPAASRTWTVDGPANLSITAGPENGDVTNDPTPSFAFSSTDSGASFSCRLDGGEFAACTSPITTSSLSDGQHSFTVEVTDTAQNTAAVSRAFTVDTTAPLVGIASGPAPNSTVNDSTPTFWFFSTEPGSTFQCRYDGHGFRACSGTRSDTVAWPLSDRDHTFYVRAIDAAGNRSAGLGTQFAVDTAAPRLEIKGPRRARTNRKKQTAVTFILSASEHVNRRCRIDSRRLRPCSERHRARKLRPGTHSVVVKATDAAGNVGTERKRFRIARRLWTDDVWVGAGRG